MTEVIKVRTVKENESIRNCSSYGKNSLAFRQM